MSELLIVGRQLFLGLLQLHATFAAVWRSPALRTPWSPLESLHCDLFAATWRVTRSEEAPDCLAGRIRGLVERVTRPVAANKSQVQRLEARPRRTQGRRSPDGGEIPLELQKAKEELAANNQQLDMHEYGLSATPEENSGMRTRSLIELREKIQKYGRRAEDELRRSRDRQSFQRRSI